MSIYVGAYAEMYDLFYEDKPYADEVAVLDRLLRERAKGPSSKLLDVACGTGRHATHFAERGWEVVGIDQSLDMVHAAERRAGDLPLAFEQQDMRAIDLRIDDFDAAVCLFDSIGYAVTNEAIVATLAGIRRHLRPDALLAMEFWHAPAMLASHDPIRVREWQTPDGLVIRISRTTLDAVAQVATVSYRVHRFRGGELQSWEETHRNRFFRVDEMDLLLRVSGFSSLRWLPGYKRRGPIDVATWHVLVLARALPQSRT